MKKSDTTKNKPEDPRETFDWSRFDAMNGQETLANAIADEDAQPLTQQQLSRMKRLSRVKLVRIQLRLTQKQFAERYGIPLNTLRDWEQYRSTPERAAQSYIEAIAACPTEIAAALRKRCEPHPA